MEDVQNRAKSSELPPVRTVLRQFAGCRIELQVVAQVFDVVWEASLLSAPSATTVDCHRDSSSFASVASRVNEGAA